MCFEIGFAAETRFGEFRFGAEAVRVDWSRGTGRSLVALNTGTGLPELASRPYGPGVERALGPPSVLVGALQSAQRTLSSDPILGPA